MGSIQKQYKFYFQDLETGVQYQLKHDVDGWRSYGVSYGRETEISEIVKSITGDWRFLGSDAQYLRDIVLKKGVNNRLRLIIKKLSNWRNDEYTTEYTGLIDFTLASWDDLQFSAPIIEGGFYRTLENQWEQKYDIPMNKLLKFQGGIFAETIPYHYNNRIEENITIQSLNSLFILGGEYSGESYDKSFFKEEFTAKVYENVNNALSPDSSFLDLKDNNVKSIRIPISINSIGINATLYAINNQNITTRFTLILIEADTERLKQGTATLNNSRVYNFQTVDKVTSAWGANSFNLVRYEFTFRDDALQINNITVPESGKSYLLGIRVQWDLANNAYLNGTGSISFSVGNLKIEDAALSNILNANRTLQMIDQETVFKSIIQSINRDGYNINFDIGEFSQVSTHHFLTSGIGLKGVNNGFDNIKISMGDFIRWIYVRYNYTILLNYDKFTDTYTIALKLFDKCYTNDLISTLDKVSNISFEINHQVLFTGINVGYSVKDSSLNGAYEYNCLHNYLTPNKQAVENVLDLVSPFSAAVYDMETFIYNNYGKFENGENRDEEIFVLSCEVNSDREYELHRPFSQISGIPDPDPEHAWNLDLTPHRILTAHQRELNSYFSFDQGKQIVFNYADRNSELVVDGVRENDNLTVTDDNIFTPIIIAVDAPATVGIIDKIERNKTGYFEFEYNGKKIKGFIGENHDAMNVAPMNETQSTFFMISHRDNFIEN